MNINKKKKQTAKTACRGAEGGIRTHVGVNPNGFQDRLVMTTSIPLRNSNALLYYHNRNEMSSIFLNLFYFVFLLDILAFI